MDTFLRRFSVARAFPLLVFLRMGHAILTSRRMSVQLADKKRVIDGPQVLCEFEPTESLLFEARSGQRNDEFTDETQSLARLVRLILRPI
jgi:hypothetical protein